MFEPEFVVVGSLPPHFSSSNPQIDSLSDSTIRPESRKPLRGKKGCPTLPNDVFFSAQRYFNRTAHPVEFVFFKTTRHMERADQMLTTFSKKLSQETAAMMADPKLILGRS